MSTNNRLFRRRITLDIPERVYLELKKMQDKYKVSMTKFVLMSLNDRFIKERTWDQDQNIH